jgi:transposase
LAWLVNEVIDEMGIERLLRKYQIGGGTSRYHPAMMTKLFVYGYLTKTCSSRMLAKAARENVLFMWLAGGQRPDFRTLNGFRGKLLKGVMEEIFVAAVKMLKAKGVYQGGAVFCGRDEDRVGIGAVYICVEERGGETGREVGRETAGIYQAGG